jgi:hypothetical protein
MAYHNISGSKSQISSLLEHLKQGGDDSDQTKKILKDGKNAANPAEGKAIVRERLRYLEWDNNDIEELFKDWDDFTDWPKNTGFWSF